MKSVLLSINPKWCELIASGKKTIEVRKTRPKMVTPYKCYIYCTKDRHNALVVRNGQAKKINCDNSDTAIYCGGYPGNGKVIGEFVCDEIIEYVCVWGFEKDKDCYYNTCSFDEDYTRLTDREMGEYGKGAPLFGWHISDLVIYDEPKELGAFEHWVDTGMWSRKVKLERPPQSWCYVEDRKMNYEEKIIWHEVVMRPMTQEEQEEYAESCEDYTMEELGDIYIFDCEMPDDGEEILVATKWGVSADVCGISNGNYLENLGDWDDVIAWAEMPKYKKENGK